MNLNTLEIGLLAILIFCFIIQLFYYWIVLAKPLYYMLSANKRKVRIPDELPPVSVIICLNDSNNDLFRFLSNILEQDYPKFEVIVVTDGNLEESEETLKLLKYQHSNLYSTHIPENTKNISRKKLALSLGIKAAKYDKLLFTEPDSVIASKEWIYSMARHFSDEKTIVLGFSAVKNANSLSQKYMAYDYLFSNLQMISPALFKYPYAGNGHNMAYTKEHFIEQKGFVKYRILRQGEDDLFINEIASKNNTAVELSDKSVILTETSDFHEWKNQKFDRMSTKFFYKRGPVAFWRMETYIRILFFAAFIACIIYGFPYKSIQDFILPGVALSCFFIRFFSQLFIINKIVSKLRLGKFFMTIILFDLFQPFVNLYFFLYRILKDKENYIYHYDNR